MRYENKQVRIGEWLGDVPEDWDYDAFYKEYLCQNRDLFDESVRLFKEMDAAIKRGAKVFATQSGGFVNEVYRCGLYDGWVFWIPRPCYSYKGPLPVEHRDEFYNLRAIRIEGPDARITSR